MKAQSENRFGPFLDVSQVNFHLQWGLCHLAKYKVDWLTAYVQEFLQSLAV
jgi:hypothetical protein